MSRGTKFLSILLLINGLVFLLYERYLLQRGESWIYYITMISISLALVSLMFRLSQKKSTSCILLVIILLYALLKFGFVSTLPSPILTLYLDAYDVYQVANSLQLGHIQPMDYYIPYARPLSTMPVVPIFSYVLHLVAGYSLTGILRHLGAGISSVLLPLSYGIVFRSLGTLKSSNSWIGALLILISSPWLLGFLVWGHYAIFSTIFVALLLWVLLRQINREINKKKVFIVYIVTLAALAFTHMYLLVAFLVSYTIFILFMGILKDKSMLGNILNMYILYLIVTIVYLMYFSLQFKSLVSMIEYLKIALEVGNPSQGVSYYGTPRASPMFVVVLKYLGLISLMILSAASLGWYYLKSRVEYLKYLLFFSIGVGSVVLILPYIFYPTRGADLFYRIFYLGMLSVSPYISYYFSTHRTNYKTRLLLGTMLTLILLFGLLNATKPDIVDWKTPIVTGNDIRFNLTEWVTAGKFTANIPTNKLYGLRAGFGPVGLFMRTNYIKLRHSKFLSMGIDNLPSILKNEYIFLRLRMYLYPIKGFKVGRGDIYKLRSHTNANIIYSGSDVFIIKTLGG